MEATNLWSARKSNEILRIQHSDRDVKQYIFLQIKILNIYVVHKLTRFSDCLYNPQILLSNLYPSRRLGGKKHLRRISLDQSKSPSFQQFVLDFQQLSLGPFLIIYHGRKREIVVVLVLGLYGSKFTVAVARKTLAHQGTPASRIFVLRVHANAWLSSKFDN